MEYASLAVTLLQTAVAGTISTGPSCQVDLTRLYNKAVTAKIDETGKTMHNVNEEISTSIFGKLVFSYVFPVISKTAAMEQVGMDDVPAAHAYFRTQTLSMNQCTLMTMEDSGPNLVQPRQYFGQFAPEWIMVLKCEERY